MHAALFLSCSLGSVANRPGRGEEEEGGGGGNAVGEAAWLAVHTRTTLHTPLGRPPCTARACTLGHTTTHARTERRGQGLPPSVASGKWGGGGGGQTGGGWRSKGRKERGGFA